MKKYYFFLMLLGYSVAATAAEERFTEKQAEAAGFAATMNFFIGRVSSECRDILRKEEAFTKQTLNKWLEKNSPYVESAKVFIGQYQDHVTAKYGVEKGTEVFFKMIADIRTNGAASASNLLTGSKKKKKENCEKFVNDVYTGKYDISSKTPNYEGLMQLVRLFK